MPATLNFTDLELRILPRQAEGYPVEITLNSEQEFSGAFLEPLASGSTLPATSPSAIETGRRLASWLFADDKLRALGTRSAANIPNGGCVCVWTRQPRNYTNFLGNC